MSYMLLIVEPQGQRPARAQAEGQGLYRRMLDYTDSLKARGVLLASDSLRARAARLSIREGRQSVVDGPFTESKELVGGFYLIDVPSMDEAIAWALRSPTGLGSDDVLTIHPMTEASDLPPEMVKIITDAAPTWSAAWRKPR